MRVHIEVTEQMNTDEVEDQPEEGGANIHGFFMENSRWACDAPGIVDALEEDGTVEVDPVYSVAGSVVDSRPKELYPYMPMLHLTGRTVDTSVPEDRVTTAASCAPFTRRPFAGPPLSSPAPAHQRR